MWHGGMSSEKLSWQIHDMTCWSDKRITMSNVYKCWSDKRIITSNVYKCWSDQIKISLCQIFTNVDHDMTCWCESTIVPKLCLQCLISIVKNIAKCTTDPRIEFISQIQSQILIKFHLQNLDQASISKSQQTSASWLNFKFEILTKPSFRIST